MAPDENFRNPGQESYMQWQQGDLADSTQREGSRSLISPFGMIIARGVLSGLGGAAQYLRSGTAIRHLWELEKYLKKSPRLRKYMPPIFEGAEGVLRRRGMTSAAKQEVFAYRKLQHAGDIELLYKIAKAQSRYGGIKDEVVKEAIGVMAQKAPAQYGTMRHLTMHDVIYNNAFTKQLEKVIGKEQLGSVRESFNLLSRSPAGRAAFASMGQEMGLGRGLTGPDVSKALRAGKGMFVQADEVVDVGRFLPKNILSWFGQFRFPFIDWKPFELMFPTEMVYGQPAVAKLSGEYIQAVTKKAIRKSYSEAIYAGEKVFPVSRDVGRGAIGEPLPGEYAIGRRGSGMYRGAAARMGITPGAFGTTENYLMQKGLLTPEQAATFKELRAQGKRPSMKEFLRYASPTSFWDKVRLYSAVVGERAGIGPQYTFRGSRVGGIFGRLKSMVRHKPDITSEYLTGELARAAGKTPEGAFLSKKMGQLASWVKMKPGMDVPKSVQDLSSMERLALRLGFEPKRTVSRITAGGSNVVERLPVAKFAPKGTSAVEDLVRDLGSEQYVYPKIGTPGRLSGGLGDWVHYQLTRPLWLLEEMTGLGMVPGRTAPRSMANVLGKIAAPVMLGAAALSYADYRLRRRGIPGPVSGPALLYTQGRLMEQWALDKMGITDAAKGLEERYPGAVSSPLSKAARFGAFTLGGAWLGAAGGGLPALTAGMLIGGINLTDITQSHQELKDIYSGEKDIPVYKSRFWMLGRDSYSGSRISHYDKSWFAKLNSRYKDIALYGSEADKWKYGSWLPTPENLLGLRKLMQPNYLESRHYWDRPYPLTGRMGEEIPLIGPWLANSRLLPFRYLKPQYRMHPEYWSDSNTLLDSVTPTQTEHAGWQLGYGFWPRFQRRSVMRHRLDQLTGEQIYRITQWTGLTGFALGFLKNQVTGSQDWFDKRPQVAEAGAMASMQRSYYDANVGGMLGQNEFFRRFLPRGRRHIESLNPIENTLPNWLPGSRSAFERDRDSHVDFQTGDSYVKMTSGEARLPGAGYEALHRMHSGVPGMYSPMDRFLILSDVSPHSDAYKHYHSIVKSWDQAGRLDSHWSRKYQEALYQVEERFRPPFEERRHAPGSLQDMHVTIDQVLSPTRFRTGDGRVYDLAGVERNVKRQMWREESRGRSTDDLGANYAQLYSRLAALQGKTVSIKAGSPGLEDTTPAIIPGINEYGIQLGLGGEIHGAADSYARYGRSASVMAWDQLRHARIPGPAGWPLTKFFGRRSAAEDYQMSVLEGGDFAGWDHPYRNFIRFWGRQMANVVLPGTRVPGEVREQRQVTEYFDRMKYVKGRHLENRAMAAGMPTIAENYNRMWQGTMTGLQVEGTNFYKNVWNAIPATERRYFKAFSQESDPSAREKILDMVPDYMQPIYLGIWGKSVPNSHVGYPAFGSYIPNQNSQMVVESQVREFFSQFRLPDPGWVGWDPSIDLERVKVRTVSNIAQDYHDYGIWESQVREAEQMGTPMAPVYGYPTAQPIIWSELATTRKRRKRDLVGARRTY